MQFMAACKSKTAAERNMFLQLWEREYDEDMGGLIYHALRGRALVDETGKVLIPAEKAA
jgi:hypothetical protein